MIYIDSSMIARVGKDQWASVALFYKRPMGLRSPYDIVL